jgi:ketosteroid isomerase-like protein
LLTAEGAMGDAEDMIDRLVGATNRHDADAIAACFAEDYENETPAHPGRGFRGREQVRRNWRQILAAVPDLHAEVLRAAVHDETAWTEWEMIGTRADGTAHHMRGVVVFGVHDGLAQWARFYLEPVDTSAMTVDEAVRRQVVRR